MTTAKPKKLKRGRPENPKYQENIHIDAPRRGESHHAEDPEARSRMALHQEQAPLTGGLG